MAKRFKIGRDWLHLVQRHRLPFFRELKQVTEGDGRFALVLPYGLGIFFIQ